MKITAQMFRRISQIYFDTPELIEEVNGICYNMSVEYLKYIDTDISDQISYLMEQIGYEHGHFRTEEGFYCLCSTEQWESRAYMCLFLAKMLEDGTLVPMPE